MMTMIRIFLIIFLILTCLTIEISGRHKHSIVISPDDKYLFVSNGMVRVFPDVETALEIGKDFELNETTIHKISMETYKTLKTSHRWDTTMPSLRMQNTLPDERMRVKCQRVEILSPVSYITSEHNYMNYVNPAAAKWLGKYLVSWRNSKDESLLMFGWMKDDLTEIDNVTMYHGLGTKNGTCVRILDFNYNQQDPRLLVLSDNTLLVAYSVYLGNRPNGRFQQSYFIAKYDAQNDMIQFGDSVMLQYPDHQKNWIPFEHNNSLYFIQTVEPLTVVRVVSVDTNNRGVYEAVVQGTSNPTIPWIGAYGLPIRGGTPAIFVRGLYLSIFHTLCMFQFPYKLRTYFMGGFALCPNSPFKMHKMSKYPIMDYNWYQGKWVNLKVDYVVFPTGLFLDPDNTHIWIIFGHQDENAKSIKINLDKFLDDMDIVNECD